MSRLSKGERLEVGKALHDKSLSFDDAHAKYGVGQTCLYMWLRECGRSVGAAAPAKPAKQEAPSDYSAMSKDELIRELMKKGIEAARLKKAMRRKGAARKRCSFLQAAGIPSDRGAAGEVARPGPLPRDAGQPERVPRMPFPAGRCWGPAPCMGLETIFHTDRGSVYSSKGHGEILRPYDTARTMPDPGTPTQNGAMEAINGWLKTELFADFGIAGSDDVPKQVADCVRYFNGGRPMCCLGYLTPKQHEDAHEKEAGASKTQTTCLRLPSARLQLPAIVSTYR